MNRNDKPFTNASQCGEPDRPRRLLCHALGGKSRPSAVKIIKEVCVNAQPRLVKQNLVLQVLQANPSAPLLLNSQVMQSNHNNSSLAIIGLGRIRQEQLCQLR
jgi:hypothetical protein